MNKLFDILKLRNFFFLFLLLIISYSSFAQQKRKLSVSLYTYLPDMYHFYWDVEKAFEKFDTTIDLVINLNPDYYNPESGIISEDMDVYEIDCILLKDFIAKNKIKNIPKEYLYNKNDFMPAANIVFQDEKLYAIPHWLCGNFLFYNKTDSVIKKTKNFNEIIDAIGNSPSIKKGLLMDLNGTTGLGEYYLDALYDEYKNEDSLKKYLNIQTPSTKNLNKYALSNLSKLPTLSYSNWDRTKDYHSHKNAFYQREFAKGNGRVYVGYSESLFDIIDEMQNAFSNSVEDITTMEDKIEIKEWTFSNSGSNHLGWVDALAIDSKLTGDKLKDALKFIDFFTSAQVYYLALIPQEYSNNAPRYLLPPYIHYYNDKKILSVAPLYEKLFPLARKINSISFDNLPKNLSNIGSFLKQNYPSSK